MPMDRSLYPKHWDAIALHVKGLASWECKECGRKCRKPRESEEKFLERIRTGRMSECPVIAEYLEKPRRFVLTVAHLDHNPANNRPSNLKALCSVCHCRYDIHPTSMAIKRQLKRERNGQLRLEGI